MDGGPLPKANWLGQQQWTIQNMALVVGIVFSSLYALGWIARSLCVAKLGIGTVDVSRESCIGAGIFLVLAVVPVFRLLLVEYKPLSGLTGQVRIKKLGSDVFWMLFLAYSVFFAVDRFGGTHSPTFHWRHLTLFLFNLVSLFVVIHLSRKETLSGNPFAVVTLVSAFMSLVYIYAAGVLPFMPQCLGGHSYELMHVSLKDGGLPIDCTLLEADSHGIIVFDDLMGDTAPDESWLPSESNRVSHRIPWERITDMKHILPAHLAPTLTARPSPKVLPKPVIVPKAKSISRIISEPK